MSQQAGVLVTRPRHQAGPLIEQISALGCQAVAFPSIEIEPLQPNLSDICFDKLDIVIFISANAVEYGVKFTENYLNCHEITLCAIGKSTARKLAELGFTTDIQPLSGFNSESLLEQSLFSASSIHNKHILIVRGRGGREFLAETLKSRGAIVHYLEVYQRLMPEVDSSSLLHQWKTGNINIVTVTSNESLKNLYHMLEGEARELLLKTPLVTPGSRCSHLARELGFSNTILQAASATDDDMIAQLKLWLANN